MLQWFLKSSAQLNSTLSLLLIPLLLPAAPAPESKPNVVIILTDDQGFGELGVTGNPIVRTPHIDRFAAQGISLKNFNVMPVCSPTRASLMTGRDYYRTGLTDTWMGNSLMDPSEITIAQMFAGAGYQTGIFGKWHLGDNYPRRPEDKGFQESLVLNGGGLAQPGDPPDPVDERGAYFNATLRHNGVWEKTQGYIGDVCTAAAVRFIEKKPSGPFLVYLAFNLPHTPHQVPGEYSGHYLAKDFAPTNFPQFGHPMPARRTAGDLARVYGMIENVDVNVGRLLAKLDELGLSSNTIVVLFSDNGCQHHNGYNAGLRGWKGSTYEGGIHQFCFIRWPGHLQAGEQVSPIASVIDVTPTLLDFCGLPKPESVNFDGWSLVPLLRGQTNPWPDRNLFFQWHRGDAPDRYRSMAVRSQDWKLVQALGASEEAPAGGKGSGKTDFELFDVAHDPLEMSNVANAYPAKVAELKAAYDAWYDRLTNRHDFSRPPRLVIGATNENPTLLTREDWRGPKASWNRDGIGYWELTIATNAHYDIKFRFEPARAAGDATFTCSGISARQAIKAGAEECVFKAVQIPAGQGRLEATLQEGPDLRGVNYVEVHRID